MPRIVTDAPARPATGPQEEGEAGASADEEALRQEVAREGMGAAAGGPGSAPALQSPLRVNELKPGTAMIQRLYSRPLGETVVGGLRRAARIVLQLGLILAICLSGERISQALPLDVPGNICSMLLLLLFLVTGVLKMENIGEASDFLLDHMSVFFIPAAVAIMGSVTLLTGNIVKLVVICLITTVLVFVVTSSTVSGTARLMAALQRRSQRRADAAATARAGTPAGTAADAGAAAAGAPAGTSSSAPSSSSTRKA